MEPIRGLKDIDDPTYRYKMPKMIFQKERTKTRITNLDKISEKLNIDISLIVGFIKKKLSINITNKKNDIIISSDVDTKSVQESLYEFIEYFVICPGCRFPELQYYVNKKKDIAIKCDSCGNISNLVDNPHTSKIIKSMVSSKKFRKLEN